MQKLFALDNIIHNLVIIYVYQTVDLQHSHIVLHLSAGINQFVPPSYSALRDLHHLSDNFLQSFQVLQLPLLSGKPRRF